MSAPRITIITPSFNQGEFIGETISSVLAQEYPNLEYMIIDGGSTDKTIDVIKSFGDRIGYWISEKDNGQSNAINKGLQKATGDLICWLNSDDKLAPNALHTIAAAYEKKPGCLGVFGKLEMFSELGLRGRSENLLANTVEETMGIGRISQPAMYFSRQAYENVGLLNEELHYVMDLEWYLRFLALYGQDKLVEIDNVLSLFRLHDSSKTVLMRPRFIMERDSLYYYLATAINRNDIADFLKHHLIIDTKISIVNLKIKSASIEKVLNNFILLLFREHYYFGRREKAIVCYRFLNKSLLSDADRRSSRTLFYRISFIPPFILNRVKSK